jgi:hypothetical protein
MAEDQAWHASSCRSDRDVHSRSSKLTQASRETLQLFLKRTTKVRATPTGTGPLFFAVGKLQRGDFRGRISGRLQIASGDHGSPITDQDGMLNGGLWKGGER